MKTYIIEFIGTFFLVLVIGLASNSSISEMNVSPPLAIGSILMIMVYMGGPISGAHYNPAVTLAVWMRKKIETKDAAMYVIVQIAGATAASIFYYLVIHSTFAPAPNPAYNIEGIRILKPIMVEAVFTFALASVVLNVATSKKSAGNSYFGLAIGFTVLAAAYAGGPISGGAFNPSVSIGPSLVDTLVGGGHSLGNVWIYIVGPCLGGIVAAMVYKITNPDEF